MATPVDIRDAIITSLNGGGSFSQSFTSAARYLIETDRSNLSALQVWAVIDPEFHERRVISRGGSVDEQFQIHVVIERPVTITSAGIHSVTEMDANLLLVDEIHDHLRSNLNMGDGRFLGSTNTPLFSRTALNEQNEFVSVIAATYKLVRS